MRIFGWTGGEDGCAFYRVEMPLRMMPGRGHHAEWDTIWDLTAKEPNTLIGQRVSSPSTAKLWLAGCRSGMYRTIYEIDDDVWSIPETSAAYAGWPPEHQRLAEACIAAADAVTTTTPALAAILGELNPNVHVIPNTIPESLLRANRHRHRGINIAWGGSPTHADDWEPYIAAISEMIEPRSGRYYSGESCYLVITGKNYLGEGKHILVRPWQKRVPGWWGSLADIDIGLAPLVDNKFNQSKSFIKILEYAAWGIPFIASNVGPYRLAGMGNNGVIGFFVDTPAQWRDCLWQLISNKHLRATMGAAARQWAQQYTIERWADVWERAYFR